MKISETLWKAANECLWVGEGNDGPGQIYSCDAIAQAIDPYSGSLTEAFKRSEVCRFIRKLGCRPQSMNSFDRFEYGEERQGARYAWLMFASMYAEEQGL